MSTPDGLNDLQKALLVGGQELENYLTNVDKNDFIRDIKAFQAPKHTKLESASIAIAAGMVGGAWADAPTTQQIAYIAETSVLIAKAVFIQANQ